MRCALVPISNAVLKGFFRLRVFRAPGSTVDAVKSDIASYDKCPCYQSSNQDVSRGIFIGLGCLPYLSLFR
jgi:hypothetical protein